MCIRDRHPPVACCPSFSPSLGEVYLGRQAGDPRQALPGWHRDGRGARWRPARALRARSRNPPGALRTL
eukprot:1137002-Alexandrium_andersonii.AAC.1